MPLLLIVTTSLWLKSLSRYNVCYKFASPFSWLGPIQQLCRQPKLVLAMAMNKLCFSSDGKLQHRSYWFNRDSYKSNPGLLLQACQLRKLRDLNTTKTDFFLGLGAMTYWITPQIFNEAQDWRLVEGSNVRISCQADADPDFELKYSWYKMVGCRTRTIFFEKILVANWQSRSLLTQTKQRV